MRVIAVRPAAEWDPDTASDTVLLDYDHRHRRRIALSTESGAGILLDLPQAVRLRHNDGLVLESGAVVRVASRPEAVLEIRAQRPPDLVRIAWHLGNRHLPVQVTGDYLRIRVDHVIAEMVRQLGGSAEAVEAPFDPEPGAYAGGHHHHDHDR